MIYGGVFITHIQGSDMGIVEHIIRKLATEFNLTPDKLNVESQFIHDIGCDSLDLAYLWYDFECDFGLFIPDDYRFSTIGNFAKLIETMKGQSYDTQEIGDPVADLRYIEADIENQLHCSFDVMLRMPVI